MSPDMEDCSLDKPKKFLSSFLNIPLLPSPLPTASI